MEYDNSKQVIVRKVVTDKPNAPVLSVQWEQGGQKFQAGLWAWTRKDGSPVLDKHGNAMYQGSWELDTYTDQVQKDGMAQAKAAATAPSGVADDDIPFSNYQYRTFA